MAKTRVRKTFVLELDLTEQESIYLKGLLQNNLSREEESGEIYAMRVSLFALLKEALEETR